MDLEALTSRVRSEFLEMPGLCVTMPQAARLWGIERPVCEQVIGALVDAAFLRRTKDGSVVRAR